MAKAKTLAATANRATVSSHKAASLVPQVPQLVATLKPAALTRELQELAATVPSQAALSRAKLRVVTSSKELATATHQLDIKLF